MARSPGKLNGLFKALADPTRRAILERLSKGSVGASAMAENFAMSLPSLMQHLEVLEKSGLVKSIKLGRTRMYKPVPRSLAAPQRWMRTLGENWKGRYDHIHRLTLEMKERKRVEALGGPNA